MKEIICRYKFQNNEKFNGKEYCTLFNEECSDIEFVCDKNCQVYEDYKQLKRLEQENEELKKQYNDIYDYLQEREKLINGTIQDTYKAKQENEKLKEELAILQQENEDIAEARMEICNQCGEKDDYNIPCKMIRDLDYGLSVTIVERDNYKQAIEEIKEIIERQLRNCSCNLTDYKSGCKSCESKYAREISIEINKIIEVLK